MNQASLLNYNNGDEFDPYRVSYAFTIIPPR